MSLLDVGSFQPFTHPLVLLSFIHSEFCTLLAALLLSAFLIVASSLFFVSTLRLRVRSSPGGHGPLSGVAVIDVPVVISVGEQQRKA